MVSSKEYFTWHVAITLIAALLFIPFLGAVHLFDWDEINFAECAREMLVSHDYSRVQINFQPFWEKPPLFIWLQVLSMKVFGVNEFAARFPDAIGGILTLNIIYYFGRKYNNHRFGLLWVLSYGASFLPFLYFKSGIIDPWFNLFMFLSICFILQWFHSNKKTNVNALYAGLFAGLAVLTKGPVAILIIGLTFLVSWIRLRFNPFSNLKNVLLFIVVFLASGLSWFLFEIITGNFEIVKEFIDYQVRLFSTHDSDHKGFILYHFLILLIGCFPASLFFIPTHAKNENDTSFQIYTKKWMFNLFWVVLILFTIVQTKIAHYSSMCYFPLTYLAAYTLYEMFYSGKKLPKIVYGLGVFLIITLGIVFIAVGLIGYFIPALIKSNLIEDKFAVACLETPVKWNGFEWIIGVLFLVSSIYFFVGLHKNKRNVYGLFVSSLVSIWMITLVIVPKIELYSQGPTIEFYESLKGKDCYVETIGFHSYAQLFYTNKQPEQNPPAMLNYVKDKEQQWSKSKHDETFSFKEFSLEWLLNEPLDKPAYFVAKIIDVQEIKKNYPDLIELYRKGGFVFYKRLAKHS
ncbi:MAG TPA: glycosyltransferase family 39 protein [Bacteroidia bacterium]